MLKGFFRLMASPKSFSKPLACFSFLKKTDEGSHDYHSILCPQHKYLENYLRIQKYNMFQRELTRLLNKNYFITVEYFNHVILEMVLHSEVDLAHQMLLTMKKFEYIPDDVTYSYLIEGYLFHKNFQKAYSLMIEANLQNIVLDLEIFYYFLTLIESEHHSFTTLLYQLMKRHFTPTATIIKKLFKLAYRFQNQELLAKLEADLHLLEYSKHNRGDLCSERLKIAEENQRKHKYQDGEKPGSKKNRHPERDEIVIPSIRVIGGTSSMIRKGKMIPITVPEKEIQIMEEYQSDKSESGSENQEDYDYEEDEESETSESSDIAPDRIIMKDGNKDSDTEEIR